VPGRRPGSLGPWLSSQSSTGFRRGGGRRQSAASQSASRSITRCRICGDGAISGLGGCKIGSLPGPVQAGNASGIDHCKVREPDRHSVYGRCGVATADGTRCRRRVKKAGERCYQHRRGSTSRLRSAPRRRSRATTSGAAQEARGGAARLQGPGERAGQHGRHSPHRPLHRPRPARPRSASASRRLPYSALIPCPAAGRKRSLTR
jgi:hypothetical protein